MKINKWSGSLVILFSLLLISDNCLSADRIEAESLFVEAQKKISSGDDATAETLLKKSLQHDPDFTSAIWQLSQIYESRGKLEHARELLIRGLEQAPDASWAREKLRRMERILVQKLYTEAEKLMSAGEYTAALPKLSLFHGIKPYDPVPLINLSRCHLALGHPETAGNYLERALERDPENEEIVSLMEIIDKRIANNALTREKERAEGLVASYSESNKDEVKKALEAVLKKDPSNRWAGDKLEELNLLASEPVAEQSGKKKDNGGTERAGRGLSRFIPSLTAKNIMAVLFPLCAVFLLIGLKRKGEGKNYSLQGNISLIPILDIVSLINSNLKTGWLEINGERARGKIFFKRGEIVHARYKAEEGKQAFNTIMGITRGKFIFYNHLPKIKRTINDPLSILLLSLKSRNETEKKKKSRDIKLPV